MSENQTRQLSRILAALLALAAVLMVGARPVTAQTPLEQAEQLVANGQLQAAFELLTPLEFELAGEPRFDLLYGYAALESGEPSIAALALERVLAVEPGNEEARLHLARTYLALNDPDSAQRAFQQLLASNPNQRIRASIGRYLEGIAASKQSQSRRQWVSYLQAQAGYDSNATGAPSQSTIFIPIDPGQLTLPSDSVKTETGFAGVNLGSTLIYTLAPGWSAYAGGDFLTRNYARANSVAYRLFAARTGLYRQFENNTLRLGLNGSNFDLDGEAYRASGGVEAEYLRTLSGKTQASVLAGYTTYRHLSEDAEVEDFDAITSSASVLHVYGETGSDLVSLSLDYGHEVAKRDRTDGDRDYYGVRASVQKGVGDKASVFGTLGFQQSDYDTTNFIFSQKREERQYSMGLGADIELGHSLSFRPSVSYLNNDSEIALYDYDRWIATMTFHADF